MDLLSGEVEALAVKTWFWKTEHKNPVTNMFDPKFYDYKDFNTLGLVILTSSKASEYGKLIVAEECKTDDSTDKSVYRLQVVLTYSGKEKAISLETAFRKRKDEKFYIYYLEDIKTSNLLKITWKFSEMKTYCEASVETGERNIKEEPKENEEASNQKRQYITRTVLGNRGSLTRTLSKELYRGFLSEMDKDVILNVLDQRYADHKVVPRDPYSTLKVIGAEERDGAIIIADCRLDMFKMFLQYLCTGTVDDMPRNNAFFLCNLAESYNLKQLKRKCEDRIDRALKMDDTYGVLLELSPLNYAWKLALDGDKCPPEICRSRRIFLCGNRYVFSFYLFMISESSFDLFLRNPQRDILTLDIHIVVKYTNERKDITLKKFEVQYLEHFLETIKGYGLLEITCTFSNIKESEKSSCDTGKSDSDDKGKEYSRKLYQEDEVGEISKSTKDKGLAALSESLKNVCLSEEDSDVILKVGDESYPAHKVIIRARSLVFKAMLEHDMTEKNEGIVDIEDCDPYIFQDFLLYLYTGKLENMSKENVFELYHISDKYDIKELKSDCVQFMLKNISVDIICDVILLATRYCERNLLARATEFFSDNTKDILETVNWQNFVKDNPIEANELFLKTVKRLSRT